MTTEKQPELNTVKGYTVGVYFPKEAPPEVVERVFNGIAEQVYALTDDREGWNPVIVGRAGDVLRIEHGCECCPPHVYFSTSCFHGDHNYCKRQTGLLGNKIPAVCKFCEAPCVCACHADRETETAAGDCQGGEDGKMKQKGNPDE